MNYAQASLFHCKVTCWFIWMTTDDCVKAGKVKVRGVHRGSVEWEEEEGERPNEGEVALPWCSWSCLWPSYLSSTCSSGPSASAWAWHLVPRPRSGSHTLCHRYGAAVSWVHYYYCKPRHTTEVSSLHSSSPWPLPVLPSDESVEFDWNLRHQIDTQCDPIKLLVVQALTTM